MANPTASQNNAQNIIVGAASLYIGNTGATDYTAKPAFTGVSYRDTLGGTPWSAAATDASTAAFWKEVGYTQEGLEVAYEPDYGDVEVDQLLDSAVVFKQSMRVSLNTTLAEATLYNLMVAWGQQASSLTSTASDAELNIDGGSLGDAPVERPFIAVGNAGGAYRSTSGQYGERVYHAYRTLNVESSTHGLKRNENTGIPVSFRALPASNGLYGKIKDRKRVW
jgi:hypothetical protein